MNTRELVEKGVPMPTSRAKRTREPFDPPMLDLMGIGDSFVIPKAHVSTLRASLGHLARVSTLRVKTRVLDNGDCRVWRAA
jgi:hypothetical protein